MNKIVLAQSFSLDTIIDLLNKRNQSAAIGDEKNFNIFQSKIIQEFKKFDLSGNKNLKLQQFKTFIDEGYDAALSKLKITKQQGDIPPTPYVNLPHGSDLESFAHELYFNAVDKSSKEVIKKQILFQIAAKYPDLKDSPLIESKLFDRLKSLYDIDLNEPTDNQIPGSTVILQNAPQNLKPADDKDILLEHLKNANNAAEKGNLQEVQRLQFLVEQMFKTQFDMWTGKNPKLKSTYDRILAHFKKLKSYAVKKAKNPKYNELYKFDKSNIGQSPDESMEKLAKKIVDNAKAQLIKPDNIYDLRNRIEIIIRTDHRKILDNPLLKKLLYDEIKKLTSTPSNVGGIDLNKQASLLKNMIKVANSLENKNFYIEADQLNKILIKIASSINSR